MVKYTKENTIEYFESLGYSVFDNIGEDIGVSTKISIQDKEGYKYFVSRHQVYGSIRNNKNNEFCCQRFAKQNKYVIENIKHWLEVNKKNFVFDHGDYKDNRTRSLWFKCLKCGNVWNSLWASISSGVGCSYCGRKKPFPGESLMDLHPELLDEWDFSKNDVDPFDLRHMSCKNVWWKCRDCGFEWKASASNRTAYKNATGCPKCSYSKGEKRICNFLEKNKIEYVSQNRFKDCFSEKILSFDFYIKKYNTCIEYQGQQHYFPVAFSGNTELAEIEFEKLLKRDKIKEKYCLDNGITFIRIPYWEYDEIENILIFLIEE